MKVKMKNIERKITEIAFGKVEPLILKGWMIELGQS